MQRTELDSLAADLAQEIDARRLVAANSYVAYRLVEAQQRVIEDLETKMRGFLEDAGAARKRAREAEETVARLQVQVAKLQMQLGIERTDKGV
jgi:polyhydroxyalkanoate synthesis regulator phasin